MHDKLYGRHGFLKIFFSRDSAHDLPLLRKTTIPIKRYLESIRPKFVKTIFQPFLIYSVLYARRCALSASEISYAFCLQIINIVCLQTNTLSWKPREENK